VLKPASRARKGVPARGVRERRREVELQVGLYVVWVRRSKLSLSRLPVACGWNGLTPPPPPRVGSVQTAFQQIEAITDRTAYFVVPFYDEIKLAILLWMLASRTVVRSPTAFKDLSRASS